MLPSRLAVVLPAVLAAVLAAGVLTGATRELDRGFLYWVHMTEAPGLELWAYAFTFLGGRVGGLAAAAAIGGVLLLRRRTADAAGLALCMVGGMAMTLLFKHLFDVPRPDELPRMIGAYGASFPSGHSLVAVCAFGYPAALLADGPFWRGILARFALLAPIAVMWSRLYLGVHWLSDVLGGALVGMAWVAFCLRWRARLQAPVPVAMPAADAREAA